MTLNPLVQAASRAVGLANVAGTTTAVALLLHTAMNLRRLRRPTANPPHIEERVSLLLPVRDEAHRVGPTLRSLMRQRRLDDVEILVLDDGSTDATADIVRDACARDPRVRLLTGAPLPAGWLGKTHACHQLAQEATGAVLVYVDADVDLRPTAVASAVALLRGCGFDAVSPYPRQLADGWGPRLVQPLLQWSLLATLPFGLAERSGRKSAAAANGQFLVLDRQRYEAAGGHAGVRAEVLEDVKLSRAVVGAGGRAVIVDGTQLATCRMYDGWPDLREGYSKSLWSAFGSAGGAAVAVALLGTTYLLPPIAMLGWRSRVGALGYAAGVASRVLVARRTGQHVWPDCLAHPLSIGALTVLTVRSFRERRHGRLTWKGRLVKP